MRSAWGLSGSSFNTSRTSIRADSSCFLYCSISALAIFSELSPGCSLSWRLSSSRNSSCSLSVRPSTVAAKAAKLLSPPSSSTLTIYGRAVSGFWLLASDDDKMKYASAASGSWSTQSLAYVAAMSSRSRYWANLAVVMMTPKSPVFSA